MAKSSQVCSTLNTDDLASIENMKNIDINSPCSHCETHACFKCMTLRSLNKQFEDRNNKIKREIGHMKMQPSSYHISKPKVGLFRRMGTHSEPQSKQYKCNKGLKTVPKRSNNRMKVKAQYHSKSSCQFYTFPSINT